MTDTRSDLLAGNEVALGFDMHGCPNRCRHCWYPDDHGVDDLLGLYLARRGRHDYDRHCQ